MLCLSSLLVCLLFFKGNQKANGTLSPAQMNVCSSFPLGFQRESIPTGFLVFFPLLFFLGNPSLLGFWCVSLSCLFFFWESIPTGFLASSFLFLRDPEAHGPGFRREVQALRPRAGPTAAGPGEHGAVPCLPGADVLRGGGHQRGEGPQRRLDIFVCSPLFFLFCFLSFCFSSLLLLVCPFDFFLRGLWSDELVAPSHPVQISF